MNKIESHYTTRFGNTKHISEPDENGYIYKVFKTRDQSIPIETQRNLLEMKKVYFGEYIPETELIEITDKDYMIKQKFIEGKTLSQTDISSLSSDTLGKIIDLINKFILYYKEQGGEMDITGYQYYPPNMGKIRKKIENFLKIYQNFLVSTNIIIGNDGNVYMVDICESADTRLLGKIKNFCAKPFIRRTISNLEKTLQKKIKFENEIINGQLAETLTE